MVAKKNSLYLELNGVGDVMIAKSSLAFLIMSLTAGTAHSLDPATYDPYTQKGYPKTFEKWGKAGVNRINKYRKLAAELVAKSDRCDNVEFADLSDNRSAPPKNIVVFVDCSNGERFYLTSTELDAGAVAKSKSQSTRALKDSAAISQCEKAVSLALKFPSSMSKEWFSSNVYRAPGGNVVVTFDFSAKNGFGIDLPQTARCVFDDRGMSPPEIVGR